MLDSAKYLARSTNLDSLASGSVSSYEGAIDSGLLTHFSHFFSNLGANTLAKLAYPRLVRLLPCGTEDQPKSGDIKTAAEDVVTAILVVAKGQKNLKAVVNVGGAQLDNVKDLKEGYNALKFSGDNFKKGGKVQLEVWDGSTMVGGGYGAISVSVCLLILP